MVQLIKPKLTDFGSKENKEEVKSQIPTDPEGIKKYLEIIPNPVGYRMLVRPWSGQAKTKGGVILADETQDKIQMTTVVGLVVKQGDLCYQDKEKFPKGPWCQLGDYVCYAKHAGQKIQYKNVKMILLYDDQVIMKVQDPKFLDPTFNLTKYST